MFLKLTHYFFVLIFIIGQLAQAQIKPPYLNNFDKPGDTLGWSHYSATGKDEWGLGRPVSSWLNSPFSEAMAWVTKLNDYTSSNADMYLETPYFDLSDTNKVFNISFKHRRHIPSSGVKKVYMEYSVGDSLGWQLLLDTISKSANWQDSNGFGYFNYNYFIHSSFRLGSLQGQDSVKFRFRYYSLPHSYAWEGWLIDNFRIGEESINIRAEKGDTIRKSGLCKVVTLKAKQFFFNEYARPYSVRTDFYFSNDTIFDTLDTYLGSKNQVITFNKNVNLVLNNFGALSAGIYYIFYEFDVLDSVPEDNENDNLSYAVLKVDSNYVMPFTDNFDGKEMGWTTEKGDYRFPIEFWELGQGARHHIEHSHSGKKAWHTSKTQDYKHTIGRFCQSECNPQYLISPPINLASDTNKLVLNFWYKTDPLRYSYRIEYDNLCASTGYWRKIDTLQKNGDDEWDFNNTKLDAIDSSSNIKFRFRFSGSRSNPEGLIIDDVYIGSVKSDLTIERNSRDMFTNAAYSNDTLIYFLNNSGLLPVSSSVTSFYWSTDSVLNGNDLYLGSNTETFIGLESKDWRSFSYTKPTTSAGEYFIIYVLDSTNVVDEMREYNNVGYFKIYQENYRNIPYYNDFESQINGWKSNSSLGSNDWKWGNPTGSYLNKAFSGNKAMITNKNGYQSSMSRYHLYTPVFDFSGDTGIVLEFDMKHKAAMNMYYSINGGATWQLLDTTNNSFTRWYYYIIRGYSTSLMFDKTEKTFSGNAIGSLIDHEGKYLLDISFLAGQAGVQFKLNTTIAKNDSASVSNPTEGALIDNFKISPASVDLTVQYKKALMLSSKSDTVRFWMNISNVGNYISDSSLAKFYVSNDTLLDTADFFLGEREIGQIQPHMKFFVTEAFEGPDSLENFNYLMYKLDANNSFSESDERNNIGYWPLARDSISVYPYYNDFEDTIVHGWHSWSIGSYSRQMRFKNIKYFGESLPFRTSGQYFTDYQNFSMPSHLFYLQSPAFDFTGAENIVLSFDKMVAGMIGSKSDGGNLEYSIDGGNSWYLLDTNSGRASNWYTQKLVKFKENGWNGHPGNGFVPILDTSTFDISFLTGKKGVVFRYKYDSKYTPYGTYSGMRLDNFKIESQNADYEAMNQMDSISAVLSNPMINLVYTVRNNEKYHGRPTRTRFYWSTDTIFDPTDLAFGMDTIEYLPSGTRDSISKSFKYPIPVSQKTYYVFYEVDYLDSISEINENNNFGSFIVNFDTICTVRSYSQFVTSCDSFYWAPIAFTFDSTGNYFKRFTTIHGCDSLVTLNLTIIHATTGSDSTTACNSYFWPINGKTYYTSGIHTGDTVAANGCDSTVTLNLAVYYSNGLNSKIKTCEQYTWDADSITYTKSGTYTVILKNNRGCDSTTVIRLTINKGDSTMETVSACNEYFWPADSNTYTSNGIYKALLKNKKGCDSLASLNLTLYNINTSVTLNGFTLTSSATSAFYQWLDCDNNRTPIFGANGRSYTATTNGNYAVIVTEYGCKDTSACYSIMGVGISENSLENTLTFYPNPTKNDLYINFGSYYNSVTITQSNATGQVVSSINISEASEAVFPLEGVPGIYTIDIHTGSGDQVQLRVIKE